MAGTLTISTLSDGTNSTSSTNCIKGSAKAWVNYAGSTATINSSFNVSSITRNSTGQYVVNFTTAMSNANYAASVAQQFNVVNTQGIYQIWTTGLTSSALPVNFATYNNGAYQDPAAVHISVFSS